MVEGLEWDDTVGNWSVSGTPAGRDAFNPAGSGVINRAFLCSSCLTVTILQLYGKLIAQYMNLSKIGCSKASLNSRSGIG